MCIFCCILFPLSHPSALNFVAKIKSDKIFVPISFFVFLYFLLSWNLFVLFAVFLMTKNDTTCESFYIYDTRIINFSSKVLWPFFNYETRHMKTFFNFCTYSLMRYKTSFVFWFLMFSNKWYNNVVFVASIFIGNLIVHLKWNSSISLTLTFTIFVIVYYFWLWYQMIHWIVYY